MNHIRRNPKERIDSLTGIRGFAAMWVLLHHLATQYPFQGIFPAQLAQFFSHGWLGVDLFFILSGFVISYVHYQDFQQGIHYNKIRRFMLLRIARVYPVHLVTTCALIPIFLAAHFLVVINHR